MGTYSKKENEYIVANYHRLGATKIGKKIGKSLSTISAKARSMGLFSSKIQRRLFPKDGYFSDPSLESCYWAGFIAADGSLNGDRKSLNINLSKKDKKHLIKFINSVDFKGKITSVKSTKSVRIAIYSDQIYQDLVNNFNIVPNKSLILQPPKLKEPNLIKAFIVGYIDGDGCISFSRNRITLNIVGTEKMLLWIRKEFSKINPKIINIKILKVKHANVYSFSISHATAESVLFMLEKIEVPKMERKWNKVTSIS